MNIIIFSKDRPMQLAAALATIAKYLSFSGVCGNISIIYTFSHAAFMAGYARVAAETTQHITWLLEDDFRKQVFSRLQCSDIYTMFYCDDGMMFAPFRFSGLADDVLCHSLRLGRNTTTCYPISKTQSIPPTFPKWDYRTADEDFAYPFAVDGHIFRTAEIFDIMHARDWSSPNTLEASMVGATSPRPRMTAQDRSCSVTIPHNRVQHQFDNRNEGGSAADLNELFLAGTRLDPFAMDFSHVVATHWPVPFVFTEK